MFTDDAVFKAEKKGCFQIVALIDSLQQLPAVKEDIKTITSQVGNGIILDATETTYLVHGQTGSASKEASLYLDSLQDKTTCVRVINGEDYTAAGLTEAAIASKFTRSPPLYYDPNRIKKDLGADARYVIVRWDRMVFASCRNVLELPEAVSLVENCLNGNTQL
jgi:hypothetical protein